MIPFRTQLKPLEGREQEREFLRLLTAFSEAPEAPDLEVVEGALRYPAEPLQILLVGELFRAAREPEGGRGRDAWARDLIRLAEEEADEEGVCWTPLLDRLEVALRRREGRRFHFDRPLPELEGRLSELGPWIRAQRQSEPLHELLRFQAHPVRRLLAEEARVWDQEMVQSLREEVGAEMVRNPHLPAPLLEPLLKEAWGEGLKRRGRRFRMLIEASRRSRLPASLQEVIFGFAQATRWGETGMHLEREIAHEILLHDPALSPSWIEEMVRTAREETTVARALVHPRTPKEIWQRLEGVEDPRKLSQTERWGARTALTREDLPFPVPAERLSALLDAVGAEEPAVAAALAHPAATEEMCARALARYTARANPSEWRTEDICKHLRQRSASLRHQEVRRFLLTHARPEVLKELFPIEEPGFYAEALTALVERPFGYLAYDVLRTHPIPEGVRLAPETLARLLNGGRPEHRLLVISLLERLQGEAPRPDVRSGRGR